MSFQFQEHSTHSLPVVPDFQLEGGNRKMLTLLKDVLNGSLDSFGRAPNDPFKLKDFDTLSPDLFRKILIYLLTSVVPAPELENHPQGKMVELTKLNQLNVFNTKVYYEGSSDLLYWNLRRVFAHNDDMFDYQLLCYPANDPKRAKRALVYLTSFVFFCEQTMERFYMVQEDLQREIENKRALSEQIEDIKTKTNARIIQLEQQKSELPGLRETMTENTDKIKQEELAVAGLEEEIKKYRKAYEDEETKNIEIEKQIESVRSQVEQKKSLIITDGEELLATHKKETDLLEAASKEREGLGQQLEKVSATDSELGTLTDTAISYANELEEFVTFLQNTVELAEKKNLLESELRTCEHKDRDAEKLLEKTNQYAEKLSQTHRLEMETKQLELQKKKQSLEQISVELKMVQAEHDKKQEKLSKISQASYQLQKDIEKITKENKEIVDFVEIEGPARLHKVIADIHKTVETFNKNTGVDLVRKMGERLLNAKK